MIIYYLLILLLIILLFLRREVVRYDFFGNLITEDQIKFFKNSKNYYKKRPLDIIFYIKHNRYRNQKYPNRQKLFARLLYDIRRSRKCKRYGLCGENISSKYIK